MHDDERRWQGPGIVSWSLLVISSCKARPRHTASMVGQESCTVTKSYTSLAGKGMAGAYRGSGAKLELKAIGPRSSGGPTDSATCGVGGWAPGEQ